jgi:NAD(P)-dependent dehydrogenase (short-subunit alcohol dehydrogenase family)
VDAKEYILSESGASPNNVEFLQLDLSSLSSVRKFSTAVIEKYGSIDVLVNNAGIMALPIREVY